MPNVQDDGRFLTLCRYVEANTPRTRLVRQAEDWPGGSRHAARQRTAPLAARLGRWPVDSPRDWLAQVNRRLGDEPLKALRRCVARGAPTWQARTAARPRLDITLRPRGRPRNKPLKSS